MKTVALIVAAGQSTRCEGEVPKQFRMLCGRPLLSWTISRFESAASIDSVVVVVAEDYLMFAGESVVDPYGFNKVLKVVSGGDSRQESVLKGLQALPSTTQWVAIHDGARPLVSPVDIDRVVSAAQQSGAAMLAAPLSDTVKRVDDGVIVATLDRHVLYGAQTPQVFHYDMILGAHVGARGGTAATDDALLAESLGVPVHVIEPSGPNLKVTTAVDLLLAEAILRSEQHG